MSNLALYRKYRSLTFDTVLGQEHITAALKSQVLSGRISHAYIFTGTRGTGKTSCARILSRAVNCTSLEDGNPCNQCFACKSALAENAMDIVEIDAASNNGVENIRELRDECLFSPASLKMRVYIIDEVHMLSTSAFNAMLKILEEPPPHVLFILATTEIHKVPITILSRCQRYDFRRISHDIISAQLTKIAFNQGISISPEAVSFIAKLGDGSMRDAISLLDRCQNAENSITYDSALSSLSVPENSHVALIWNSICEQDIKKALNAFSSAYEQGRDILSLFDALLSLIRDIYITKSVASTANISLASSFTTKEIVEMSAACSTELLDYFISTISQALAQLSRSSIRRMDGEVCLIKLCQNPAVKPLVAAPAVAVPQKTTAPVAPATQVVDDPPPFNMPIKKAPNPAMPYTPPPTQATPATQASPAMPYTPPPTQASPATQATPAMPSEDNSSLKQRFLSAVASGVNVATKHMLAGSDIYLNGGTVVVLCDNVYLELLQRTSVTTALNNAAAHLGYQSVRITDIRPPDKNTSTADSEGDSGIDELILKARDLGFLNNN